MKENESRFRQANDTPFMCSPLLEEFGYLGIGPNAQRVLRGEYVPPRGTDPYAVRFLKHLKMKPEVAEAPRVPSFITTAQYEQGWKVAKERTSCGSDTLHFGHFKAGVGHEVIAPFEASMANFPYSTGYSPNRWRNVTDAELLKKRDDYRPSKLRTIQLFEPEFNSNNKLLGRESMRHCEQYNLIAPEQYGSRKDHTSIKLATSKVLSADIIRQQKIPAALCSNDAKSCYDRIQHSCASLIMQSKGLSEPPIVCMFSTLQNLVHRVRTVYGDSTKTYGGDMWVAPLPGFARGRKKEGPQQGIGQGNGMGPTGWAIISTPALEILYQEGYRTVFKACISGEEVKFVGYVFVDDDNKAITAKEPTDTFKEVAEYMQEGMILYEGLLRVTGGGLVPDKSWWYLLDFVWHEGDWHYMTKEEAPAELQVKDYNGVLTTLKRLRPDEARQELGVRSAPSGNIEEQVRALREVAVDWREKVRTGHLQGRAAWIALTTRVMKTIEYSLPAMTMNDSQSTYIMAPILDAGLNALKICKNFPRTVVYAPEDKQGLGIHFPYTTSGIYHVDYLLSEGQRNTHLGLQLRITLENMKLEVGVGGSILSHSYEKYGILATDSWIKWTWHFLDRYGMTITENIGDLPLRRERDSYLMAELYRNGARGRTLQLLNQCRKYLHAVTLSDITTGDGCWLEPCVMNGVRNTEAYEYYTWPRQGRPGPNAWSEWRKRLRAIYCNRREDGKLVSPLGAWIDACPEGWQWFYSVLEDRLYRRVGDTWTYYRAHLERRNRSHSKYANGGRVDEDDVPQRLYRATVRLEQDYARLTGYALDARPMQEHFDTLDENVERGDIDCKWAVEVYDAPDGGAAIAEALRQGTAIAVSDGSFKLEFGTSALVIEGADATNRVLAVNVIPGDPENQSSYRSELGGIYGQVVMVNKICEVHNVTEGAIESGCDGIEAVKHAFWQGGKYEGDVYSADFDLVSAIRKEIERSPVKWTGRHVEGHQDDDGTKELDRWATLNVEMDNLAKAYWADKAPEGPSKPKNVRGEYWPLRINGQRVVSKIDYRIRDHIHGEAQRERWERKGRMTVDYSRRVNWDACGEAAKRLDIGRRHWVVKHVAGHCGVNEKMKEWKKRDTDICPMCQEEIETARHVWQCQSPEARVAKAELLAELRDWMKKQATSPEIVRIIMSRMTAWANHAHRYPQRTRDPLVAAALLDQDGIGWTSFLEGAVATGWTEAQHSYFQRLGSRRSGRRWTIALIKKLWEIAWDLWEFRNGIFHHHENESIKYSLEDIDEEVVYQHRRGAESLLPRYQYMFACSTEDLLEMSAREKLKWLSRVHAARGMGQTREARGAAKLYRSRNRMKAWLTGRVRSDVGWVNPH